MRSFVWKVWLESPSPVVCWMPTEKSNYAAASLIFHVSPVVPMWGLPVVAVSVATPVWGFCKAVTIHLHT